MQRIAIIGPSGAGKSTLSRRLGTLLDLPVIHLDALNWKPGWVSEPDTQWRQKVRDAASGPKWIIDGNYGGTLDLRLQAADTVIFLDFPRWVCVCRVLWRIVSYHGRTRPDMGEGCPERFDMEFLEWVWNFNATSRPMILRRLEGHGAGKRIITLRCPRDVEAFVRELKR